MLNIRIFFLFLSDIALLYAALGLTLLLRYDASSFSSRFSDHLIPFSTLFFLWILVFYLIDLYHTRTFSHTLTFLGNLSLALIINVFLSIAFFYIFTPFFELTPKTNLLLFAVCFGVLSFLWRFFVVRFLAVRYARSRIILIGNTSSLQDISSYLQIHPHAGYDVLAWIKDVPSPQQFQELSQLVIGNAIDLIVVPPDYHHGDALLMRLIYRLLPLRVDIIDASDFYELLFRTIPLDDLRESWFIEKITTRRFFYDSVKRILDIILSLFLLVLLFPLALLIALFITLTSRGPVLYTQARVGINETLFTLYKFRTMRANADAEGPLWATPRDTRVTAFGALLRYAHLDEIPQLINILRGDISFVGPRPERAELVETYRKLPYYEVRHIIKPGLTGWAQINYRPSASLEEAYEKLKYDIYYIKNRSLVFDILITIKTIRLFFVRA